MKQTGQNIILFDGVCNLCNVSVYFVIKNDNHAKFRFASLQSDQGTILLKQFGLPANNHDTIVYLRGSDYFLKSTAILMILNELGGIWKLFYIFMIIPKGLRDRVYDFIAKIRYRVFGKYTSCPAPHKEFTARFLE